MWYVSCMHLFVKLYKLCSHAEGNFVAIKNRVMPVQHSNSVCVQPLPQLGMLYHMHNCTPST